MDYTEIKPNQSLTDIPLPNKWVLFLYNKDIFRKIANQSGFFANPQRELCNIISVNDIIYIIELLGVKCNKVNNINGELRNIDVNDYIIMRQGINPIWEDPKNKEGGTFSIKTSYEKGYNLWMYVVMFTLGETLTNEMENINGITVSYISGFNNGSSENQKKTSVIIKIWDAKPGRSRDDFVKILPNQLIEMIKDDSLMYVKNTGKKDFNNKEIITKINTINKSFTKGRGGGSRGRGGHRYR